MIVDPPDTVIRAYAKINLGLLVTEKRPDGYHEICTVFHRVELFDDIEMRRNDSLNVISTDSAAPSGASNICHTAGRLLQDYLHSQKGVEIRIRKRIPVGAGLGGGSADAAAVLQNLPQIWGSAVPPHVLRDLALRLGSDVPYFLGSGSAIARGRGEILEYFALDIPFAILLCAPSIAVSTQWAYRQILPRRPLSDELRSIVCRGMSDPGHLNDHLVNDFEEPVFAAFPEIRAIKETIMHSGALYASMSGSGSSVYGFYPDGEAAARAAEPLILRGYRTFITSPHFQA